MIQTIYWEVDYDGTGHLSEAMGATYADIDRERLQAFRLRDNEGPIIELTPEGDRTGQNLVYRRRTVLSPIQGSKVVYIVGWVPMGPIWAVDSETLQVYQTPSFVNGDSVFYPPAPNSKLGERWTVANPTRILRQEFERTSSFPPSS